jgi:hypothetical protein
MLAKQGIRGSLIGTHGQRRQYRNRYFRALVVAIIGVVIPLGCFGKNDEYPITGVVCMNPTETDSGSSYILTTNSLPEDCIPIPNATIYLSSDKEGRKMIKGFDTQSDLQGRYKIVLTNIPKSSTRYGNDYFLIAKKDGYQTVSQAIKIGPLSRYLDNTIVLRPIPKKELRAAREK